MNLWIFKDLFQFLMILFSNFKDFLRFFEDFIAFLRIFLANEFEDFLCFPPGISAKFFLSKDYFPLLWPGRL